MRRLFFVPSVPAILVILVAISIHGTATELAQGVPTSRYYLELARVHQRYGFHDEAIEMYLKAIDAENNGVEKEELLIGLAKAYLHAGSHEIALKTISDVTHDGAVLSNPIEYYMTLAEINESLGEPDKAAVAYEQLLRNCKTMADSNSARRKFTRLLRETGQLKDHIERLERQREAAPDDLVTMECLAHAYSCDEARFADAAPLYEELFEKRPGDRDASERLVELYKQMGECEKAAEVYVRLMGVDDDLPDKHYCERISALYLEAGKPEVALKWDRKIVQEDPESPYAYLRVAERYQQLENTTEAEKMLQMAIDKATGGDEKELLSLKLVDFYIDCEVFEKAENLSRDMLDKTGDERIRKELNTRIALIASRQENRKKKEQGI